MTTLIDHLVVVATTLEEGVAWCEDTLGVIPGPGGSHALMGTHNRLLRIATEDFPTAYLEIISIQPGASPTKAPGSQRWFDMDDPALRNQIARHGPQLVHFVASVPNVRAAVASLTTLGIERGEVVQASRPTPAGLLQWMMTIRPDGQRLFNGCLPTLIEWGASHPAANMPPSGVTLHSLYIQHPDARALQLALEAIGLTQVPVSLGSAQLSARLQTPKGLIELPYCGV